MLEKSWLYLFKAILDPQHFLEAKMQSLGSIAVSLFVDMIGWEIQNVNHQFIRIRRQDSDNYSDDETRALSAKRKALFALYIFWVVC